MNISHLMRNIISEMQPTDAKTLELKVGQVVKGLVLQLLADQDALVNIGGVQLKVHLEVPLKQGQVTLLQVQPEANGQIVMKAIADPDTPMAAYTLVDLLNQVGLKDKPANRILLQELHKVGITITKENVLAFTKVISEAPTTAQGDQWKQGAIVAAKRGLPMTTESVRALHQVLYGKPVIQTLGQLSQQIETILQSDNPILPKPTQDMLIQTKLLLDQVLKLTVQGGLELANLSSNSSDEDGDLLQHTIAKASTKESTNTSTITDNKALIRDFPIQVPKQMAGNLLNVNASNGTVEVTEDGTLTDNKLVSKELPVQQLPNQQGSTQLSSNQQGTVDSSHKSQNLTNQPNLAPQTDAVPLEIEEPTWISKMLKSLGVEHEQKLYKAIEIANDPMGNKGIQLKTNEHAALANLLAGGALNPEDNLTVTTAETLKGALLMLASTEGVPAHLKETGQQLLQQVTGQQLLLSPDRNSVFTHITLMIPMQNSAGDQTAAVHIQSRKGSRGQIDANNCRLLFDLRMKALGDTLVDVQVANKIVSLHVHNDQSFVGELLENSRSEISGGLQKLGYQFLSLKCSPFPKEVPEEALAEDGTRGSLKSLYSSKPYKGVDIRV